MDRSSIRGSAPSWRETFKSDALASVVVFLVALPLCIGIAVAVGVSPARALITGIVGGIVVGYFAGSPLQVSGPAAGLFVIIADLITRNRAVYLETADVALSEEARQAAAMEFALLTLGAAVMIGGGLQLIAGKLKLGQWFRAVSPAVINGMLAGIGVLIFASQFHVMLDHDAYYQGEKVQGGVEYLITIPDALLKCLAASGTGAHHWACATGLLTIAIILLWQKFAPRRVALIPGPLVAVIAASLFAGFFQLSVNRLDVPANMFSEVSLPNSVTLAVIFTPAVLLAGLVIAIVASAETLLSAAAVDQMQQGPRTDYDRELCAQGVGNLLCGFLGALPMTGVIVRSSTNVQAGAKTRLSTILHGCWLLLFVVALPGLLTFVPKAALGAILVYTGVKLVNFKGIRKLWQLDKCEAAILLTTMTVIVVEDLLLGVVIGIILSAIKLLHRFSHLSTELQIESPRKAVLRPRGTATFIRLPRLAAELERVSPGCELHVDLSELAYIDHACLELLMSWAKRHSATGGGLVIDWDSLHAKFRSDGQPENGAPERVAPNPPSHTRFSSTPT